MDVFENSIDLGPISGAGIRLIQASDNDIIGNRATRNQIGIGVFVFSSNNRITGNITNENFRIDGTPFPTFGIGIAVSVFSEDNKVMGNEANDNTDVGIVVANGASNNIVLGNVADNNENYGIGIFTRTDLGAPTPTGNLIQGNSALGNGRADLLEVLFDPFDIPRESIQPCMNTWMGNAFVSQIGPVMCIE